MEDKILTAHETTDELTTEPILEEPAIELVPLYLVLDTSNRVVDLSLTEGTFYQDIPPDADLEQIKTDLNIASHSIFWDGYLYEKEVDLLKENELLAKRIDVLTDQLYFRDELIQELALMVYE